MNNLPEEIKWRILTFLPLAELTNCVLIDSSWYSITTNTFFWREIGLRDRFFFADCEKQGLNKSKKKIDWKETFKKFLQSFGGFKKIERSSNQSQQKSFDVLGKLLLIGDSGVGKSSLLLRFSDDDFSERRISTIGVDFKIKTLEDLVEGRVVKLQLWDTAGEERFRTVTSSYYRGCHGIFLCFDLTERHSFDHAGIWFTEIERYVHPKEVVTKCIVLVGCKCDLTDKIKIKQSEIDDFCLRKGIVYVETSSKDNINVDKAFFTCSRRVMNNHFKVTDQKESDVIPSIIPASKGKSAGSYAIFDALGRCSIV